MIMSLFGTDLPKEEVCIRIRMNMNMIVIKLKFTNLLLSCVAIEIVI
jgi:hypothetical protein